MARANSDRWRAAMTQEQFEDTVRQLEQQAAIDPSGYKLRVGALTALEYAYIYLILLALVALVALAAYGLYHFGVSFIAAKLGLKVILPLLVLAGIVMRAMWVRFEPPAGIPLAPAKAPQLVADVEEIRRKLKAPKVHKIRLTIALMLRWFSSRAWVFSVGTSATSFLAYRFCTPSLGNTFGELSHTNWGTCPGTTAAFPAGFTALA